MVNKKKIWVLMIAGILFVALIGLIVWIGQERLSGYNTEVTDEHIYREPTGIYTEYFTGTIVKTEWSLIGPKITVKKESSGQDRTFYLSRDALIWLGLIIDDQGIKGDEKIAFKDLKKGQRVAVFVGKGNTANHIHILVR